MDNNIVARLQEFMTLKSLNSLSLSKELGYKSSEKISRLFRENNAKPSYDIIFDISNKFGINGDWLISGRGAMYLESTNNNEERIKITERPILKDALRVTSSNNINGIPIPLVTEYAVAGFGNKDFVIAEDDVKDYYVIPKFRFNKIDFMIEIHGTSMDPNFKNGDVVACTILRNSNFMQWNRCYIIATKEQGILLKRLLPGEDTSHLVAVSDNKEFPPFKIPVDDITGIAMVAGLIRLE